MDRRRRTDESAPARDEPQLGAQREVTGSLGITTEGGNGLPGTATSVGKPKSEWVTYHPQSRYHERHP